MEINKLVWGGLAVGCMAAAAGGGYLAARQTAMPTGTALVAPASVTQAGPETATAPVSESEGIITPEITPEATSPPATPKASQPQTQTVEPRRQQPPRPSRTTAAPESRVAAAKPARPASERPAPAAPADSVETTPAPAASAPAAAPGMWEARPTVTPEPVSAVETEPEPPPAPEFTELVVPSDSVLGLQIERTISSETARVEDRVEARVTRDVRVGDRVAIPAGSIVQGSVAEVERGGKVRERARLAIRFHTVVLGNGSRLSIKTDSVVREGTSPTKESAAKIGGAAVGGAILGAILGGGKGAIIGGATGAAGGTAATMAGDRNPAVLPVGSTVSVRMQQPVTVTIEK